MASAASPESARRQVVAWVGLAVLGLVLLAQAGRATGLAAALGLADYIAYWSAGHQNAHGANPYAPEELLALQRDLGWSDDFPNMMYYPPWTLALVMPFGVLPYALSRLAWLILHLGLVLLAADRIWRFYGGAERYRLLAWMLALCFVPTLIVLRMGQIGPILLLGIVGFLEFERRGWDWLAGAALLLPAIKPQLVYLFGLAVLLWAVDRRRWRVLLGGALTALAALGIAAAFNPHVLEQYRYALANPPSVNVTPTIGAMLRLAFGAEHTWLQFLPTVVGMIWLPFFWLKHRRMWSWGEQAPILLFASFLTTAYGAWVFDLVVLLLPVLQVAVWVTADEKRRLGTFAVGSFVVIEAVALVMNLLGVTYPAFIWMAPVLLVIYLIIKRFGVTHGPQPVGLAAN